MAAQVAYYSWATAALGGRGLAFAVPTGNFGNVLSGWVARACGMPLERLVIGSNANDILPRLVAGGRMEMRDVVPTLSPSMDIQVSSNLERLLFELYGRDPERTASELAGFARQRDAGARRRGPRGPARAVRGARARRRGDARGDARRVRPQRHAAGSAHGRRPDRRPRAQRRARRPLVALATAHPAKFPEAVERATGVSPALRRARRSARAARAKRARERRRRGRQALVERLTARSARRCGQLAAEVDVDAERGLLQPQQTRDRDDQEHAEHDADDQKPAPESSPPAESEATAAQRATTRSLVAVSTPRSAAR